MAAGEGTNDAREGNFMEESLGAGDPSAPRAGTLYGNAGDGLKAVREDYLYWTGRLTDTSFQLSLAVIAANWAVFGSVPQLLDSTWAKTSLSLVVLSLGLSLLGAKCMGELHRKRIDYAAEDLDRWETECSRALGRRDPWPFTARIERLGRWMRELKTWLPVAAGAAFLTALLVS